MRRQSAFTLIEIIVTIVVIGIASTALLSVFGNLARSSADPALRQQATTIAEAYLEEILLRSFDDPQGLENGLGNLEGESGRSEYDDVQDYSNLPAGPAADQFGNPVPALAAYTVTVTVTNTALEAAVPVADTLRVDVRVNHPAVGDIELSGFRTRY